MRPTRTRTRKEIGLVSSLAMATVLAAGGTAIHAQSFQGTGTVVAGSATINVNPTTPSTTVTVNTSSAVINWTPSDTGTGGGPIDFQPANSTATFQNNSSLVSDFAVLNRILPTDPARAVQFNGTVISRIFDGQGIPSRGGTVFFYSPGGILLGANAVFDVGNLALTASDLSYNAATGAFDSSGSYLFQQSNPGARIDIANGAQITAGPTSAYVALVAPSITQNGTITVDGSAALVAADAATMTFRPSGLFDIQVTSGTSASGTVLSNSGTINGPVAAAGAAHRVYMVAVPKNDAITLAIAGGSNLGFDIAGAADTIGNTVVLSAGHDVLGGSEQAAASAGGGSGQVDMTFGAVNVTSALVGRATGSVSLAVNSGETAAFASDLSLFGAYRGAAGLPDAVSVSASGTGTITVGGDLFLRALDPVTTPPAGGGAALLDIDGGSLDVGGDVTITADRIASIPGGNASGGIARARFAGTVDIVGGVNISASAFGAETQAPDTSSGSGTGGRAELILGSGGTTIGGSIAIVADGNGGSGRTDGSGGGNGTGGFAELSGSSGGTLDVLGSVEISATGRGGDGAGCVTCASDGGLAAGGTASFLLTGTTVQTVTIEGSLGLTADGLGGIGQSATAGGGRGTGGIARIVANQAAHDLEVISGGATLSANGRGGDSSGGASGALGEGGSTLITADKAILQLGGPVSLYSNARGGESGTGASGGNARLGEATVSALGGGSIDIDGSLTISTTADAGSSFSSAGGIGGEAAAGDIFVLADGGNLSVRGSMYLDTTGFGGFGGFEGNGGAGTGGDISVLARNGGTFAGDSDVVWRSDGFGGDGIVPGAGTGGNIDLTVVSGTAQFTSGSSVSVYADGNGGGTYAQNGVGGTGTGGAISFTATDGLIRFSNDTYIHASGSSGSEGTNGNGGNGVGGRIALSARDNGSIIVVGSTLHLDASGFGAPGGTGDADFIGGRGGDGTGGTIDLSAHARSGSIVANALDAEANGHGAYGGSGNYGYDGPGGSAGDGGNGTGGTIRIDTLAAAVPDATTGRFGFGSATLEASGFGGTGGYPGEGLPRGAGGAGGSGTGGLVSVSLNDDGARFEVDGFLQLRAYGSGGDGQGCASCATDGGAGVGGNIFFGGAIAGGGTGAASTGTYAAFEVNGAGGYSRTTAGANGTGGSVDVVAGAGLTISAAQLLAGAAGYGGEQVLGLTGGIGTGGRAVVNAQTGGRLNVSGSLVADALGAGGGQFGEGSFAFSDQYYGSGTGTGGAGTGGEARVFSGGGVIAVDGDIVASAQGLGGHGDPYEGTGVGGTGTGGRASVAAGVVDGPSGNGGLITIGSVLEVAADGIAGGGGLGGTGRGGEAAVVVRNGTITGVSAEVHAEGKGGYGAGGDGGAGTGGTAIVVANNDVAGIGTITLGEVSVSADGFGGDSYGSQSGAGPSGAGGSGTGGVVSVVGSAGSGRLVIDSLVATASGSGGEGGEGVYGLEGSGGTGGAGGSAAGGVVTIGTQSGVDTGSLNQGSATFGDVLARASAYGGNGNYGGNGVTGQGAGGAGGNAVAGRSLLLVRGSPVTITRLGSFLSEAVGGEGGTGSALGAGGSASIGGAGASGLVASSRFEQPGQRGTLTANTLTFTAVAIGGAGSVQGATSTGASPLFVDVASANVTATSIDLVASAASAVPGAAPSTIRVVDGQVNVADTLGLSSPGDVSLTLDGGDITADVVTIDAGNWVLGPAPAVSPGRVIVTDGVLFTTNTDLVAYAGLTAPFALSFSVPGNFRLDNITAGGDLTVIAGGLVTVGQQWSAPSIDIRSADIEIAPAAAGSTAPAGLSAGTTGSIRLVSLTSGQTLIGDGLSGTGYALSNTEWRLINSGRLTVIAPDNAGQTIDMLIGNLTITGPDAGSTIDDPLGAVAFGTGNLATLAPGGAIRIQGNVTATGFRETNALEFVTGRFELDAATGSLAVTGTGGALSGIVDIDADGIHVASAAILDKLAANPAYAGVAAELNAPAPVQRRDGVIRAGRFDLTIGRSLMIQNTGTALDRAGFVAVSGFNDVTPRSSSPAGSITMIVNGKFQTDAGLVGGSDAHDLVVENADDLSIYAAGSQINACLLSATVCGPATDPVPALSNQFTVLGSTGLADLPGVVPPADDGDDEERDNSGPLPPPPPPPGDAGDGSDSGASPITPPAPIIDNRPLNPSGPIEEPISGSGNPALIGSVVDETNGQGDQQ